MACSTSLQQKVITTCERLHHFHRKHKVICGCEFQQYKGIKCNVPYLTDQELQKMLDEILQQRLTQIGPLGHQRPDKHEVKCYHYIGNCAEVHSANTVYKQMQPENKPQPERLNFAVAYRIKTLQPIDYCQNCKDTFQLDSINP